MKLVTKAIAIAALCAALVRSVTPASATGPQLAALINRPYLELLELKLDLELNESEIEAFKKQLDKEKQSEESRLDREEKQARARAEEARKQLSALNKQTSRDTQEMTARRRELHCAVLKLEHQMREKRMERKQGLPVAFENKRAKLELIRQWPSKRREIEQTIAEGRARLRPHGDVEDIGVRRIGEEQQKDLKLGEDAIREMKAYGLMPPEVEDKELKSYVQERADQIAANSDLKVPVRVTILESAEINAFALPGGFLYVNTGLIQKAGTESELVGVMSHELAHVAARHGARLMKRAAIANIIYQAAQVAALIFTGGAATVGVYYALQYGFFGLGLAINLALLGVSREYEAEADQLGAQYAWRASYDPRGFITFFDRLASEKGYVKSASFFRTHPPFLERILATFGEISYLPAKDDLRVDSMRFKAMKQRLEKLIEQIKQEKKNKPTLRRWPECGDDDQPIAKQR